MKISPTACFSILAIFSLFQSPAYSEEKQSPIVVGWIGAMTGPVSKYAAFQSATLAMEDINRAGGIRGRELQLSFQDGKCTAKDAIDSANSLLEREKVNVVIGGHCSTESLAIAPLIERKGAIMMAASSSSPKLTGAGDHVFRVTAPFTIGIDLMVPYLIQERKFRKMAVLYEETEYAEGIAEYLRKEFSAKGGSVPIFLSYKLGESDFLSLVTKIKSANVDGLYLSVQSPDSALLALTKVAQLGLHLPLFGNEITGNSFQSANPENRALFESLIFAEPFLPPNYQPAEEFTQSYKKRFKVDRLPNGFWSMEYYDAVRVVAAAMERCGFEVEAVKKCLYETKDFQGVSGHLGFDSNGDGIRQYRLKQIRGGIVEALRPE